MWFGRYTWFLEKQIDYLQARVEALETRNQELVLALVKEKVTFGGKPEPKHLMSRGADMARCSCGWHVADSDPASLATKITAHYRENIATGTKRKSWGETRDKLEQLAEMETK